MTREEAIQELTEWREQMKNHGVPNWSAKLNALNMAIEALRHDVIFEQTKWERDTALATLEEHGIGLGQRAEPSDLCSSCWAKMKGGDDE